MLGESPGTRIIIMRQGSIILCEAEHFTISTRRYPHITRSDGGHLVIDPKTPVHDRTQLTAEQAKELIKLTMVAGEALATVLNKHGVDVRRINYQDNGNWREELHVHIYGRAQSATIQKWGTPLTFPPTPEAFKEQMQHNEALTKEDVAALRLEIAILLASDTYKSF